MVGVLLLVVLGWSALVAPPAVSSDATVRGAATYCSPTPTHCQGWGGNAKLGAVPSFHYGDKPYTVEVCAGRCVTVTVVSYCACGDRHGVPTVIDLSPAAFRVLAPLSRGVIPVTIGGDAPSPTLPPTDVAP